MLLPLKTETSSSHSKLSCSHLKLSSSHFPLNYKREKLIPLKREESLPLKVWPLVSTRHQLILGVQRKIPKQGLVTKPKSPLSRNELKLQSEYKLEEYCSHRKKAKYHPIIPNGFLRNMLKGCDRIGQQRFKPSPITSHITLRRIFHGPKI